MSAVQAFRAVVGAGFYNLVAAAVPDDTFIAWV
jgi:hypothetical protein